MDIFEGQDPAYLEWLFDACELIARGQDAPLAEDCIADYTDRLRAVTGRDDLPLGAAARQLPAADRFRFAALGVWYYDLWMVSGRPWDQWAQVCLAMQALARVTGPRPMIAETLGIAELQRRLDDAVAGPEDVALRALAKDVFDSWCNYCASQMPAAIQAAIAEQQNQ